MLPELDQNLVGLEKEALLPGLGCCDTRSDQSPMQPSTGWWVKTSSSQTIDRQGVPAGFKHQLMHGGRCHNSGRGADAHRAFSLQATYFKQKGISPRAISSSSNLI
jgi:hypothetical protein